MMVQIILQRVKSSLKKITQVQMDVFFLSEVQMNVDGTSEAYICLSYMRSIS